MNTSRLQRILAELQARPAQCVTLDREMAEVAFEVTSAETFVAGIAVTLVGGKRPDPRHGIVLMREYLVGSFWRLDDGRRIDLRPCPEVHGHARLVDELTRECRRLLGD